MSAEKAQIDPVRQLYAEVRRLEGLPSGHTAWAHMIDSIGGAWQRYQITDDDAAALETMLRTLRFHRR